MPAGSKIVIADAREAIPLHNQILGPRYQLLTASEYTRACDIATEEVDLVVCGVHFDESRMFEFFSTVRRIPKPFVCFRGLATPITPGALRVIKLAGEVLGSAGFIDFVGLRAEHGFYGAVSKTVECVEQAIKGKTVECD
jgi:hypothetical protein